MCGICDEYNDMKLVFVDSVVEEKIFFFVIKIQVFGDIEYSKFILVINVFGIVVIGKKGIDRGLFIKVMVIFIFYFWFVFVLLMVIVFLVGIIIWILVSCFGFILIFYLQ